MTLEQINFIFNVFLIIIFIINLYLLLNNRERLKIIERKSEILLKLKEDLEIYNLTKTING